jgi:hypothetical protein
VPFFHLKLVQKRRIVFRNNGKVFFLGSASSFLRNCKYCIRKSSNVVMP